jgi:hypothetical protein
VFFTSPDKKMYFQVLSWGPQPAGASIDGLRNDIKTNWTVWCNKTDSCHAVTDLQTGNDAIMGTSSANYYGTITYDDGSQNIVRTSVVLLDGVAYVYEFSAPAADFANAEKTYFAPIFKSLNIFGQP